MRYQNRDISWLAFNGRVLQEAGNPEVPLYERIKFMAIYSANLDEFFRVRISALRFFKRLPKAQRKAILDIKPRKELEQILQIVQAQQNRLGEIFQLQILDGLQEHGIALLTRYHEFHTSQAQFATRFFETQLKPLLQPLILGENDPVPFLENRGIYFIVPLAEAPGTIGLVNIPSTDLPRFIALPTTGAQRMAVTFLDEILRMHLPEVFRQPVEAAYAIKMSRDAELYIDDEYSGDLAQKIRESLQLRDSGLPTRLLYDAAMPPGLLAHIRKRFGLKKPDLIPGGRFHNFHDFMDFPKAEGIDELFDPPLPPLPHPILEGAGSIFEVVQREDQLLHLPYQRFDYLVKWMEEAVRDSQVEAFYITMYRVGKNAAVVDQLLKACAAGKKVVAFIEAKARFDEAANLEAGQALEAAGAQVLYSLPGLKVHCKALLIERREAGKLRRYAYLSTGNFHEKTARIYADHALFTADPELTEDVARVFGFLQEPAGTPVFQNMIVSPWYTREKFTDLICREIAAAKAGKPSGIMLKMNSLEDLRMVDLLYEASAAGVPVRLIVRGICCLIPGLPGLSEHIEAISIIDRFLEHARVYVFENGGQPEVFLASADWMSRNLDRRIEMVFPIHNPALKEQLQNLITLQWRDNVKARRIGPGEGSPNADSIYRAQAGAYTFLERLCP